MKNPGWANNRGSPPYISRKSSYQIPLSPNAPAAMTFKAKAACGDEDGSQSAACVQISTVLSGCLHFGQVDGDPVPLCGHGERWTISKIRQGIPRAGVALLCCNKHRNERSH